MDPASPGQPVKTEIVRPARKKPGDPKGLVHDWRVRRTLTPHLLLRCIAPMMA